MSGNSGPSTSSNISRMLSIQWIHSQMIMSTPLWWRWKMSISYKGQSSFCWVKFCNKTFPESLKYVGADSDSGSVTTINQCVWRVFCLQVANVVRSVEKSSIISDNYSVLIYSICPNDALARSVTIIQKVCRRLDLTGRRGWGRDIMKTWRDCVAEDT